MILYLGQVRRDGGPGGGVLGIISGEGGAHVSICNALLEIFEAQGDGFEELVL